MLAEEKTSIAFTTIQCILFIVGLYLQIRTFSVVRKQKDLTWEMYIINGIIILIYYPSSIFVQSAEQFLYPLSQFTGVWFCHVASFVKLFGIMHIYSHSLVIAILMYIFIVHKESIDAFGKPKAKKVFVSLYMLIQVLFCITLFTNPKILNRHVEYPACFGTDKEKKESNIVDYILPFCQFKPMQPNGLLQSFIYVTTECFCVFESIMFWLGYCNLLEAFFYYKIFQFIYR